MTDPRCCGTDSCIIDADGACWCGQKWDGEKMCFAPLKTVAPPADDKPAAEPPAG